VHELSLAEGILQIAEGAAQSEGFARVATLQLEAGRLAGVDVHALRFALETLAPGTVLDGAEFQIEQPEARATCIDCDEQVWITARGDACPRCGGYHLRVIGGTELRVIRMTVHDA
jgi:hydrogenase nickel incorporation protein HypA/HybF